VSRPELGPSSRSCDPDAVLYDSTSSLQGRHNSGLAKDGDHTRPSSCHTLLSQALHSARPWEAPSPQHAILCSTPHACRAVTLTPNTNPVLCTCLFPAQSPPLAAAAGSSRQAHLLLCPDHASACPVVEVDVSHLHASGKGSRVDGKVVVLGTDLDATCREREHSSATRVQMRAPIISSQASRPADSKGRKHSSATRV
jgi:hypothetical protein